jgi:hypothetical protein
MSNKKQTAVDWLFDRMVGLAEDYDDGKINYIIYINGVNHFLDQAKEMEKQQITEGFKKGLEYWNGDEWKLIDIEQYYKETYEQ